MPKHRIGWNDYKVDYEEFSGKISDAHFPRGKIVGGYQAATTYGAAAAMTFAARSRGCGSTARAGSDVSTTQMV